MALNIEELRGILERNYEALGFRLESIRSKHDIESLRSYVQGVIQCPCGNMEYFSFAVDKCDELCYLETSERMAYMILSETASKEHLLQDVKDGTLPAFDIDKHCFKGKLIEVKSDAG